MTAEQKRIEELEVHLGQFLDTIDATGGIVLTEEGLFAPAEARTWLDLGLAYADARKVLGRPVTVDTEPKGE